MAGNIEALYGTSNQKFTLTLASLANSGARESTVIDNSSTLFTDLFITIKVKSAGSSTSSSGVVNVYMYGTSDGGTTYEDNATGSNANVTLVAPPNVRIIGVMNVVANSTTYKRQFIVRGPIPQKWGIIVENKTGAALDSTEGNHDYQYQGHQFQYT